MRALSILPPQMEIAEIDTVTTGAGAFTANTFTDGITLDGTCACRATALSSRMADFVRPLQSFR
jgi:hypothetical protein